MKFTLRDWSVDYGDGPQPVQIPHAWGQDQRDVRWEGPAIYRCQVDVPPGEATLVFSGVSAWCRVEVSGIGSAEHLGIWDAFEVPLGKSSVTRTCEITVNVIKNGGATHPVKSMASGFLPYVYHTFGGIFRDVEVVIDEPIDLMPPAPTTRIQVDGAKILLDGQPTYLRGLLHWGWYPNLHHAHPDLVTCEREILAIQAMGFNMVKFCLWMPPHHYLELLEKHGMWAWIELPLWFPPEDPLLLQHATTEIHHLVNQYRRHSNICAWTAGCELGATLTVEQRQDLVSFIRAATGCPLVKDSSGGAEMYGGDLREAGTFNDFHPYCDLTHFPKVLDLLAPGSRPSAPTLLGEFNDFDCHRDIARLRSDEPYWLSEDRAKNDVGVRWQHDLPALMPTNRFASGDPNHAALMESSRQQKRFVHQMVNEDIRSRGWISGIVITGLRDTPISSTGFFDDWDQPRFSPPELESFNQKVSFFRIPSRALPWVRGGNRVNGSNPYHHWEGPFQMGLGVHSEVALSVEFRWTVLDENSSVVDQGSAVVSALPLDSTHLCNVNFTHLNAGQYRLCVSIGEHASEWPFVVVAPPTDEELTKWLALEEVSHCSGGEPSAIVLSRSGPQRPAFRECAFEIDPRFRACLHSGDLLWADLLQLLSDRTLDPAQLPAEAEVVLRRIDTRTYEELPIAAVVRGDERPILWISMNFSGGYGTQPATLKSNPAAVSFLRKIEHWFAEMEGPTPGERAPLKGEK